jgi:predicted anti-sigma-YlaC factor YlaD
MLRCREVAELVGTDRFATASLRERLGVRMHLLMCRHCRAYVRSLRQIANTARRLAESMMPPTDEVRAGDILAAVRREAAARGSTDQ